MERRCFLAALAGAAGAPSRLLAGAKPAGSSSGTIHTVRGPIDASRMGTALVHEHVLVDFAGAEKVSRSRYDADEAFRAILPHLQALRRQGCRTLLECTPAYLGRDPLLLRRLSEASDLQLVTNAGYYGAANDSAVPKHAYAESPRQLADRWTAEASHGIEGTGVRATQTYSQSAKRSVSGGYGFLYALAGLRYDTIRFVHIRTEPCQIRE